MSESAPPNPAQPPGDHARSHAGRRPVTVRIARWSAQHPWRAIITWLVFVVCCVALGQVAGLRTATDLDLGTGQSGRAARVLHTAHLSDPAVENVLITAPGRPSGQSRTTNSWRTSTSATSTQPFDLSAARASATELAHRMTALPQVASVAAPTVAANHRAVLVAVTLRGDPETAGDRVDPLLAVTRSVQATHPGLRVEQVGGASLGNAVNAQVSSDLGAAARYSLPITLVILLVVFGAIVAAGVPVLLALSAVGSAIGLSTLASHLVPDSGSTSSMILLIGMAVGVDYSLFYVRRMREEITRGRTRIDALDVAAETSGHSVLVSGVAVIVAMLGLFVADDGVFSSLATGSIIVVAIAVLGSLTVLPALLAKLVTKADRSRLPRLPGRGSRAQRSGTRRSAAAQQSATTQQAAAVQQPVVGRPVRESRFWTAILRPSLNHPGRTLAVSVLLLLALAAPAAGLKLQSDSTQSLPRSIPAVQTLDRLATAFPGQQATQTVVVTAPASRSAQVGARLRALESRLAADPLFAVSGADRSPVRASADGTVHELLLDVPFDAESAPAEQGVRLLRTSLLPATVGTVPGASWAVGGDTATNLDHDHHLADRMPWVIGFVVLMTMLMMALIFRSVVLALTTAFVNLLSAGAAFGVLALVFQHTWAQGLLGFRSSGAVVSWIPLFTFAVLFGLSMDYHVFVVSRIREVAATGVDTRTAVRLGITRTAGTVTSAAVVMVSVFAIFAGLHMIEMKEIGVGLAVAVLVDALLVRAIVLPALMTLLGRANWWPVQPFTPQPVVQFEQSSPALSSAGR